MQPVGSSNNLSFIQSTYRKIESSIVRLVITAFGAVRNFFEACKLTLFRPLTGRVVGGSSAPAAQVPATPPQVPATPPQVAPAQASSGTVTFDIASATLDQMQAFFREADRLMNRRTAPTNAAEIIQRLRGDLLLLVQQIEGNLEMPDVFMKLIFISKAADKMGDFELRGHAFGLIMTRLSQISGSADSSQDKFANLQDLIAYLSEITQTPACQNRDICARMLSIALQPIFLETLTLDSRATFAFEDSPLVSDQVRFGRPSFGAVKGAIDAAHFVEQDDSRVQQRTANYVRTVVEVFPGLFLGGAYPAEEQFNYSSTSGNAIIYKGGYDSVKKFDGTVISLLQSHEKPVNDPLHFGAIIRCAHDRGGVGFEFMKSLNDFSIGGALEGSDPRAEVNQETLLDPAFHKAIKLAIMLTLQSLACDLPVLVHCRQGFDRSAAVAALIGALLFETTVFQAAESNRCHRPEANPFTGTYGIIMGELWLPILRADPDIQGLITRLREHWA